MPLPELDPDQRRAALEKATAARRVRAEVKERLKLRSLGIRRVLELSEDQDAVAKMKVADVLGAMPAYGPVKARRLMEDLDIAPNRRLRGLGARQRAALIETFEGSP